MEVPSVMAVQARLPKRFFGVPHGALPRDLKSPSWPTRALADRCVRQAWGAQGGNSCGAPSGYDGICR